MSSLSQNMRQVLCVGSGSHVRMLFTCKRTNAGEVVAVKVIDASTFSSIAQIEAVQEELAVLSGLRCAGPR